MITAVIKTGGKQYVVSPGKKLKIEKLNVKDGETVKFPEVLLWSDGEKVEIGTPFLEKTVEAKILKTAKDKKKIVFKYRPKKRYRKKKGHRQILTEVQVL